MGANLYSYFKQVDRVVTSVTKDYEHAGEMTAKLQTAKGYNIKKSASITNDCLIAASTRSIGAVLFTQNKKDFQAIGDAISIHSIFT